MQLSGGNFPWGECSGAIVLGGNCPRGATVLGGNCLGGRGGGAAIAQGGIVLFPLEIVTCQSF